MVWSCFSSFFFLLIFEFLGYRLMIVHLLLKISQLLWMFAIFWMGKQFRSAVSRACKLEQIEVDSILAEAHWDYDGNCNQLLNNLTTAFDAVNVVDCILGNCSIVKSTLSYKLHANNYLCRSLWLSHNVGSEVLMANASTRNHTVIALTSF